MTLRGTTLGWALEAGFNRVWIAGWWLLLPALAVLEALTWGRISMWAFIENVEWFVGVGLWPSNDRPAGPMLNAVRWAPLGIEPSGVLGTPSLVAVAFCIAGLLGCWVHRRRGGSVTAFLPVGFVAGLAGTTVLTVCMLASGSLGSWLNWTPTLWPLGRGLVGAGVGGVAIWGLLTSRDPRALPRCLVVGAVLGLLHEAPHTFARAFAGGEARALRDVAYPTVVGALQFGVPVLLAAAVARARARVLLGRWPAIAVLLLIHWGWRFLLALVQLYLPETTGMDFWGEVGNHVHSVIHAGAVAVAWCVHGIALLGSLWLIAAIAALGELGEDGAPVDSRPAQQQP